MLTHPIFCLGHRVVPTATGPDPDRPCGPPEDGQHLRQRG